MGISDNIKGFFDAHPNLRIMFKYSVIGALGGLLYIAGKYAAGLSGTEYGVLAVSIIGALNDKFKLLNPLEPWPVVGIKQKK